MSLFSCQVCGHVAFNGAPEKCPVCMATQFMQKDDLFKESAEKSKEAAVKHVPSITVKKECKLIPEVGCVDVLVRIGQTLHPMEAKHYIMSIDCYLDNQYVARVLLTPGVNPAACFHLRNTGAKVTIVEHCNIHGFWMAEAAV
jgi:superoxide reductase